MDFLASIDTPSVAAAIFLISATLAIGMTAFWQIGRTEPGFGYWVAAQWSLSLGLVMLFARGFVALPVSVGFGNGLFFVTLILVRMGIGRFRERAVPIWPDASIAALIVIAITINAASGGLIETRTALVGATLSLLALRCASALHGLTGLMRAIGRFTQRGLLLVSFLMLVRAVVAVLSKPGDYPLFQPGLVNSSLFLTIAVACVALPFVLVVLNNARTLQQLHLAREAAESASETDALTGLMNRRGLFRSIRGFDRTQLIGVCLIDLDHFKRVNDNHGHDVGDRVLMQVAKLLQEEAPDCLIARMGGEEFLMVVPDADHTETLETAERIRVAVAQKLGPRSGLNTLITTSIGSCSGPRLRFDELLTSADLALYRAKNAGRDRALGSAPGDAALTPSGRQVRYRTVRQPERSRS